MNFHANNACQDIYEKPITSMVSPVWITPSRSTEQTIPRFLRAAGTNFCASLPARRSVQSPFPDVHKVNFPFTDQAGSIRKQKSGSHRNFGQPLYTTNQYIGTEPLGTYFRNVHLWAINSHSSSETMLICLRLAIGVPRL